MSSWCNVYIINSNLSSGQVDDESTQAKVFQIRNTANDTVRKIKKYQKRKREKKREAGEYEKYVCPKKYQERLENNLITAREYRKYKKAEKHK